MSHTQNINVYLRCRPLKNGEQPSALECNPDENEVIHQAQAKAFNFDRVFTTESTQEDVYQIVVKPLINEVLNGLNCTVFAYGQTGTGKTYTMEGINTDGVEAGIIPRAVAQMFDTLRLRSGRFSIRVSFLELYNEEVYDLLSGTEDTSKLRIYDDVQRKNSVRIEGLKEKTLDSVPDIVAVLTQGSLKRQTAATLLNAHSSRSHSIFCITVLARETDSQEFRKVGKLNLVDLAGSENIARSGAQNKNAREAGNINQSLLTLTRVISALVEKRPHIPYRESKLTRILQDSLGGTTRTSMIATISLAETDLSNTVSTLDYASRARCITNNLEYNRFQGQNNTSHYNNNFKKCCKDHEKEILQLIEKHALEISQQEFRIRNEVAGDFRREIEKRNNKYKEDTENFKARILEQSNQLESRLEQLESEKIKLENENKQLISQVKQHESQTKLLSRLNDIKTEEALKSQQELQVEKQRNAALEQEIAQLKRQSKATDSDSSEMGSPTVKKQPAAKRIKKQAPEKANDYANMTFDGDDEIVQVSTKKVHKKLTGAQKRDMIQGLTLSGKKKRLTTTDGVEFEHLSPISPPVRVTRTRAARRKLNL